MKILYSPKRLLLIGLFFAAIIAVYLLSSLRSWIGQDFTGLLFYQNGLPGHYFSWAQPVMTSHLFTTTDYILLFVLPIASGLFFILLGFLTLNYYPHATPQRPLAFFYWLSGMYMILSVDFHTLYRFVPLHLIVFLLIPGSLFHLSTTLAHRPKKFPLVLIGYALGCLYFLPYAYLFQLSPKTWFQWERFAVFVLMTCYGYWILTLYRSSQGLRDSFETLLSKSILLGQISGFIVPFGAAVAIYLFQYHFPLNIITPLTLLFPLSLLIGILVARVQQAQKQSVETAKLKSSERLLAGLAHELKNPLNFIYANMEPLQDTLNRHWKPESQEAQKDVHDMLRDIGEGAERMKGILESLRLWTLPKSQTQEVVSLQEVLQKTINLLSTEWKGRIDLTSHFPHEQLYLHANRQEIGQVLMNLLSNACQAIPDKGFIRISLSHTTQPRPTILIIIEDSGSGISMEDQKHIFEPFFTTKAPNKGTGLGLAITQQLIHKWGGRIDCASSPDKGTRFIISFPEPSPSISHHDKASQS